MLFLVPEEGRAAAYGCVLPASSRMRSGSTILASLITVSWPFLTLLSLEKRANVGIRFEAQS
jgi:hypothetical protein